MRNGFHVSRYVLWMLCLLGSLGLVGAQGQDASGDWNQKINELSFLNRTESEYRLGSGDLIEVSVFGVDDFQYQVRLNSRGQIQLPFVGTIEAQDRTPAALEEQLKQELEGRFIQDPQVSVFVREYRSRPVMVMGAVRKPGQYQMIHQLRLVDVIAMAGGLDVDKADHHAMIQSKEMIDENGNRVSSGVKVDLRALLEQGDISQNIPINGGDVVHVPERKMEFFYVVGEVNQPGAFEVPQDAQVFVSQAVTWAGGPGRTAKTSKGILVRYDGEGGRRELSMNFSDIIKGREADFLVQPNDIIFIPGSTAKTLAYGLLQVVPSTVSTGIVWGMIR